MDTTQNNSTPTFKISENWDAQSKQLKQEFPQLTDTDLIFEPGKEEDLINRVASRLNKNREEVIDILKNEEAGTQNTPQ